MTRSRSRGTLLGISALAAVWFAAVVIATSDIGPDLRLAAFLHLVAERPLHAHVAKHNVGSIRVLEKCGFSLEREESVEVAGKDVAELVLVLR